MKKLLSTGLIVSLLISLLVMPAMGAVLEVDVESPLFYTDTWQNNPGNDEVCPLDKVFDQTPIRGVPNSEISRFSSNVRVGEGNIEGEPIIIDGTAMNTVIFPFVDTVVLESITLKFNNPTRRYFFIAGVSVDGEEWLDIDFSENAELVDITVTYDENGNLEGPGLTCYATLPAGLNEDEDDVYPITLVLSEAVVANYLMMIFFGNDNSTDELEVKHQWVSFNSLVFEGELYVDDVDEVAVEAVEETEEAVAVVVEEVVEEAVAYDGLVIGKGVSKIAATDFDSGIYGKSPADGAKDIRPDEDVNTETNDTEFGGNIGWIAAGDWVQYTVEILVDGVFKVDAWIGSGTDDSGPVSVYFNGIGMGTSPAPENNGWGSFDVYNVGLVDLIAGTYVIKVEFPRGGLNFAGLEFTEIFAVPYADITIGYDVTKIAATDFDSVVYRKSPADGAKDMRPDEDVNTEANGTEFGGNIGWIATRDWVQYTVNVAVDGLYRVDAWIGSGASEPGPVKVFISGMEVGTSDAPVSDGWGSFDVYNVGRVSLKAGTYVIKAIFPSGNLNFAGLEFTRLFGLYDTAIPESVGAALYGDILVGELIGTTGWGGNENADYRAAFDGDIETFFDPEGRSYDYYAGMKLDEAYILTGVRIHSRIGHAGRFLGATIQGSNDGENWTTLWVSPVVADSVEYYIVTYDMLDEANTGYSYYRYVNVTEHGDVAEVEFWGIAVEE